MVHQPPLSARGLLAGQVVCWAGEGNEVFDRRESAASVCGGGPSLSEVSSFVRVIRGRCKWVESQCGSVAMGERQLGESVHSLRCAGCGGGLTLLHVTRGWCVKLPDGFLCFLVLGAFGSARDVLFAFERHSSYLQLDAECRLWYYSCRSPGRGWRGGAGQAVALNHDSSTRCSPISGLSKRIERGECVQYIDTKITSFV